MEVLEGYTFKDSLYKSENSEIFRGVRNTDGLSVVIKTTRRSFNSSRETNRLRHEFSIGQLLSGSNTINYLELLFQNDTYYLISEDIDGIVLKNLIGKHGMDLGEFLIISKKIAEALGDIHAQNVIHKDINPTNILYLPTLGEIKIIDFDISTSMKRENQEGGAVNLLEGTLDYISPEQTGRMNRTIDYRSDYYSLGITFYEMLTGVTPFSSKDKLELIHAHLAIEPKPIHKVSPNVPEMLSRIVSKLISKNS
ncbi:serine/threonine-protein kinase [Algoriphagus boritolerans]|uniref:serine/threonine protein kinase n=1 Tax=Algoriphagus boritolerans TaxID=308111 RepID=UPI000AE2F551